HIAGICMRVLIISIHYPPIAGTSSRAMAELSIALANAGHEVDVLTVQPAAGHPVYRFATEGGPVIGSAVSIHRIPMGPINRLVARAMRRPPAATARRAQSTPLARVGRLVNRVYQTPKLWQSLAIPDASIDWLPGAILHARRMVRQSKFDL